MSFSQLPPDNCDQFHHDFHNPTRYHIGQKPSKKPSIKKWHIVSENGT